MGAESFSIGSDWYQEEKESHHAHLSAEARQGVAEQSMVQQTP